MKGTTDDPRALIQEAYRIEGIHEPDCRTIFLDWAMGFTDEAELRAALARLLAHHEAEEPDHPMTRVLREGMSEAQAPKRRGGRRARLGR